MTKHLYTTPKTCLSNTHINNYVLFVMLYKRKAHVNLFFVCNQWPKPKSVSFFYEIYFPLAIIFSASTSPICSALAGIWFRVIINTDKIPNLIVIFLVFVCTPSSFLKAFSTVEVSTKFLSGKWRKWNGMARPPGLEPGTPRLEIYRFILLNPL